MRGVSVQWGLLAKSVALLVFLGGVSAGGAHAQTRAEAHMHANAQKHANAQARVDLNRATEAQLISLPGIGPAKARAILDYKRRHGPFVTADDLVRVPGLGEKTVARLKPHLVVATGSRPSSLDQSQSIDPDGTWRGTLR